MHNTDPCPRRDPAWSPPPGPLARGPRTPGRRTLPSQYLVSRPSPPRRTRSITLIGMAVLSLCGLGLGFLMACGSDPMPSFASGPRPGQRSHTGDTAPVAEAEAGAEAEAEAGGGWGADDGAAGTPRPSPAVRAAPEATEASDPDRPADPAAPSEPARPGKAARPPAKADGAAKPAKGGRPGTAGKAGKPVKAPAKSDGRPPAAPGAVQGECARRFPGDPTRQRACAAALHGVFGHR